MRKKITAVAVSLIMIVMMVGIYVPTTFAAITANVTGTFTPQSEIIVEVNASTLTFGAVTLDSNNSMAIRVNSSGTAYCSVSTTAEEITQNWTITAADDGTSPTGQNQYCVDMTNSSSWGDASLGYVVNTSMPPGGIAGNHTNCTVHLVIGTKTDKAQEEMTFYLNMTGAAVS